METLKKLNSLYSKTEKLQRDKKERKKLNIVIIGGSHSGFSCAWILLNGPSNPNINPKKSHKEEQQREEENVVVEEHLKNITNRSTTSLHNEKEMYQKENSPGPRDPSPKKDEEDLVEGGLEGSEEEDEATACVPNPFEQQGATCAKKGMKNKCQECCFCEAVPAKHVLKA
jgi:hypothetical protein